MQRIEKIWKERRHTVHSMEIKHQNHAHIEETLRKYNSKTHQTQKDNKNIVISDSTDSIESGEKYIVPAVLTFL